MKPISLCLALFLLAVAPLFAQPAIPAQPADPNQGRPALPVLPNSLAPNQQDNPPTPATNAAPAPTPATPTAPQVTLTIIADNSLKQVLQELAQSWADAQDSSPQVPLTLTNAGTLRAKVEAASNWDVVISADIEDMKELTDKGIVFADGQHSLARNTLVIYGRKALVKDDELDWFDLTGTEWKKVALGNPDLTASGRVARRALQKHDLIDDAHKDIFVNAPTEALALAVVEREEADAVFLYKTDLAQVNLPGFEVFPLTSDDAPPVFYVAAIPRLAKNPTMAHSFIDYCGTDAARAIWAKYGFETN
jgi:molybdate transport system substrate-binding protein